MVLSWWSITLFKIVHTTKRCAYCTFLSLSLFFWYFCVKCDPRFKWHFPDLNVSSYAYNGQWRSYCFDTVAWYLMLSFYFLRGHGHALYCCFRIVQAVACQKLDRCNVIKTTIHTIPFAICQANENSCSVEKLSSSSSRSSSTLSVEGDMAALCWFSMDAIFGCSSVASFKPSS